jgi:hypothetical protein
MLSPMTSRDPEGHYARLGVDPGAAADAITAAWRRKARMLHPDVPGTGDARAFVALKQAYDVLISPERRAAYDRLSLPRAPAEQEPGEIGSTPFPEMATPPTRHPRPRDLPVAVWVGMAAVLLVGAVEIGLHLAASPQPVRRAAIQATMPEAPPPVQSEPAPAGYGPIPVRLAGTPNFYITPTATSAMLWRLDAERRQLVPLAQLPPFSEVQGLRLLQANGLVEVKVTDTSNGYVEAARLTPGDSSAASRAWCTFNAGPAPANGEVLTRNGTGAARLAIENRSGQPAVVKIRGTGGEMIASVFLDPGGRTTVEGLPVEQARLDVATGEAWSRACHCFAAGMRAVRMSNLVTIGKFSRIAIPLDSGIASADLSDRDFQAE